MNTRSILREAEANMQARRRIRNAGRLSLQFRSAPRELRSTGTVGLCGESMKRPCPDCLVLPDGRWWVI